MSNFSNKTYRLGIDSGSTTVKIVLLNECNEVVYKQYHRHFAAVNATILSALNNLQQQFGNIVTSVTLTGSAGMGVAERCEFPFVQEVVASGEVVATHYSAIKTLVDIGGEDAKMIFFHQNHVPDIRMNGSCAGGTGAFIDQMATLLNVDTAALNTLAENADTIYPIASRCGVFSKTDIQNLLSRNISTENIAASIFHAVSMQIIASLSRGCTIAPPLFLSGGPFTYLPSLQKAFLNLTNIDASEVLFSDHSEVIPAWGAALMTLPTASQYTLQEIIERIQQPKFTYIHKSSQTLSPLFHNNDEWQNWLARKAEHTLETMEMQSMQNNLCYIGIDSGSTTTKIVATNSTGQIIFRFYTKNNGLSLAAAAEGLQQLGMAAQNAGKELVVAASCVTGYGEDLLKKAYSMPFSVVETMAHFTAARHFNPEVSFILDIGGQDMKATFVDAGTLKRIDINEACSSGCGSFIETFANSLNYSVESFSKIATLAQKPYDLGTRCTVFMNSKVKQALREGVEVADIAAGLGYSVVKNCLHKVLRLRSIDELGPHIMVQGGTFRNHAVLRALELETKKDVMITDAPELMGAYGAALFAIQQSKTCPTTNLSLDHFIQANAYTTKNTLCKGCENVCAITAVDFAHGEKFFTGNKCEKFFNNQGSCRVQGENFYAEKYQLLFNRPSLKQASLQLGIPRALGMYENYPFWHALFVQCGINPVLSDPSTMKMSEKGIHSVMSDNICFPAKLTNGHIVNLIEKKVDRIFLPFVVYEQKEDENTVNSYNCPIVTGYSEVIRSAMNPNDLHQIPFDSPTVNFRDEALLYKACKTYIQSIAVHVDEPLMEQAFQKAQQAQWQYEMKLCTRSNEIFRNALETNTKVILLAGRPYHSDPLIQHKIADMIAGLGVAIISDDIVRDKRLMAENAQSIMQWAYTNRVIKAAQWAAEAHPLVHFVEITSFGCGPDAFILDEINDILKRKGRNATFLKVDDINNIGSTRLRIRSLIESIQLKEKTIRNHTGTQLNTPPFTMEDKKRKILIPWFGDFYSPFIPPVLSLLGYESENLPPSDKLSGELGLKYSNNEICYPATLIVGDFMKALYSGKYNPESIALGITQTGGQCRATNYVALIKKAVLSAGFNNIPVVSVTSSAKETQLNEQPGFEIDYKKIMLTLLRTFAYADCLSQLYHATAPREKIVGKSLQLKNKYIQAGVEAISQGKSKQLYSLMASAGIEFGNANTQEDIPRIGIVGEIFVKYNSFAHSHLVNWLLSQRIEPVIPPLADFFTAGFASVKAQIQGNIRHKKGSDILLALSEKYVNRVIEKMEAQIKHFPYFRSSTTSHHKATLASPIINLNAQFGEGWGIPAEFAHFATSGVNNVISLQPFGCIANHIIAKGIEKRTRELYPALNLLFLDFDSGMGDANIFNRVHFMIHNELTAFKKSVV